MLKSTNLSLMEVIDVYFIPCMQVCLIVMGLVATFALFLINTEPCTANCNLIPEAEFKAWVVVGGSIALLVASILPKLYSWSNN